MRRETDCALILQLPVGPLHLAQWIRGYEDWLMDMASNPDLFEALMDKVTEIWLRIAKRMLDAADGNFDIIFYGDDVAYQNAPMCGRAMYETRIKARQQRLFDLMKQYPAKILYHSCGSVISLVDDFIELGVDAMNPVQVSAEGMDPETLKRKFGDRIAFWGGVDTQYTLCQGSVEEVRKEVRERIRVLAPGGGYVLCAVHDIQAEVPPANIEALYQEGLASGSYPIRV